MPDMKAVDMDTMSWECIVADGTKWRSAVKQHLKTEEDSLNSKLLTAEIPSHLRPHIDVTSATKAVTPTFVSSATIDAATSEQEMNTNKTNKTH